MQMASSSEGNNCLLAEKTRENANKIPRLFLCPFIFLVCLLLLTEHDQLEYQMAWPLALWWILRNDYNHVRFAESGTPPLDPAAFQFQPASTFVACVQIETFPRASLYFSLVTFHCVFPRLLSTFFSRTNLFSRFLSSTGRSLSFLLVLFAKLWNCRVSPKVIRKFPLFDSVPSNSKIVENQSQNAFCSRETALQWTTSNDDDKNRKNFDAVPFHLNERWTHLADWDWKSN